MCKYCEGAKHLTTCKDDYPDNDDYGIAIFYPGILVAYGYDIHGGGSNGISVRINYCPMCGKKLVKE